MTEQAGQVLEVIGPGRVDEQALSSASVLPCPLQVGVDGRRGMHNSAAGYRACQMGLKMGLKTGLKTGLKRHPASGIPRQDQPCAITTGPGQVQDVTKLSTWHASTGIAAKSVERPRRCGIRASAQPGLLQPMIGERGVKVEQTFRDSSNRSRAPARAHSGGNVLRRKGTCVSSSHPRPPHAPLSGLR